MQEVRMPFCCPEYDGNLVVAPKWEMRSLLYFIFISFERTFKTYEYKNIKKD